MRLPPLVKSIAGHVLRWTGIVALNYHRIGDDDQSLLDRGLWSASEEDFDAQVEWFTKNFDVIGPRDIPYVLRLRRGRHVLISFDDGYADNYTKAFPILRSHGAQAAFFVATGFIDRPTLPWWDVIASTVRGSRQRSLTLPAFMPEPVVFDEPDREGTVRSLLRLYKSLPGDRTAAFMQALADAATIDGPPIASSTLWMTWDMLREMKSAGMTIGGHTINHPILSSLSPEEQLAEIRGCAARLEQELGISMQAFAYPVGTKTSFNDQTRACLEACGVRAAFSYYGGYCSLDQWDPLGVPRLAVERHMTLREVQSMVMFPYVS